MIDYRNPDQPAVLLIMERLKRDLYHALRGGLDFAIRYMKILPLDLH